MTPHEYKTSIRKFHIHLVRYEDSGGGAPPRGRYSFLGDGQVLWLVPVVKHIFQGFF